MRSLGGCVFLFVVSLKNCPAPQSPTQNCAIKLQLRHHLSKLQAAIELSDYLVHATMDGRD